MHIENEQFECTLYHYHFVQLELHTSSSRVTSVFEIPEVSESKIFMAPNSRYLESLVLCNSFLCSWDCWLFFKCLEDVGRLRINFTKGMYSCR
jgi:hypothetical protein